MSFHNTDIQCLIVDEATKLIFRLECHMSVHGGTESTLLVRPTGKEAGVYLGTDPWTYLGKYLGTSVQYQVDAAKLRQACRTCLNVHQVLLSLQNHPIMCGLQGPPSESLLRNEPTSVGQYLGTYLQVFSEPPRTLEHRNYLSCATIIVTTY